MVTVSLKFDQSICFIFVLNSKIILQIFGAFAAPILGLYLLGLFSSRVKSRVNYLKKKDVQCIAV